MTLVQVKLRIPASLKHRLYRAAAKRDDGSLSAEIADRLKRSFERPALEAVVKKIMSDLVVKAGP